jgi:hypothetical protein
LFRGCFLFFWRYTTYEQTKSSIPDIESVSGKATISLAEPINHPQPLTKPHRPILIGSSGEKNGLRLVAQYADACDLFAFDNNAAVTHKLDILKRHCDEVAPNYDEIERTVLAPFNAGVGGVTVADVIENCRILAGLGIQMESQTLESPVNYYLLLLIKRS